MRIMLRCGSFCDVKACFHVRTSVNSADEQGRGEVVIPH